MCPAFRRHQRVYLVEDHGLNRAKCLSRRRRENQVERLRSSDQDVRRMAAKSLAFALGSVSGSDADLRFVKRHPATAGHIGNPSQRRSEITFDIDGKRLQRGDVEYSCSFFRIPGPGLEHQTIKAPEECGQGLASAGGSKDEGALVARDYGPTQALRRGWPLEDRAKPFGRHGMETCERV